MATRTGKVTYREDGSVQVLWEGITEADDGSAVSLPQFPDKTVQAFGDFTASGAITMEGSPDGTAWATLRDNTGTDIVLTSSSPRVIAENTLYVRPRATAGTAVDMDVLVTAVK